MFYIREVASDKIVVRMGDGACIPEDESNTDYQRYLEWVAEGNSPLPWPPEA